MSTPRLDDIGRDALRDVAADIITDFRGSCNRKLSTRKEMRWGSKGSLALVKSGPKEGLWFDHELNCGGDIIEFIKHELGCRSPRRSTTPAAWYRSCAMDRQRTGAPTHHRRATLVTTNSASSKRSRSGVTPGRCPDR